MTVPGGSDEPTMDDILAFLDLLLEEGVLLMRLSGAPSHHPQQVVREAAVQWMAGAQAWLDRNGPRPVTEPAADIPHGLERIMAIGPRRPVS